MVLYPASELLKAKKMAIGTVSRGRKKVAEGKWVDIPKGRDPRSAGEKMKAAVRTGPKVNTFERKLLSSAVQEAVPESYYTDIPLREIDDSMRKRGFLLLQEDNTPWAGMLLGSEGSALITIGRMAGTTKHDWGTTHQPIENSALALSWYRDEKRGDRRYDVVAYAT